MRALFSGVTGIRTHQVRMDVIGNNIANVNTTGFKASRVTFGDVLSQTMSIGSAISSPQQVGLGVGVASTDLMTGDGSLQMTGRALDLAVEGAGMFVVKNQSNGTNLYTRAGNFDWDSGGYLVVPGNGERVQGWVPDATGKITNTDVGALSDIQLIRGSVSLAKPTTAVKLSGNLDAGAADQSTYDSSFTAFDSLGRAWTIPVRFTRTGSLSPSTWTWSYLDPSVTSWDSAKPGGSFSFNNDGTQQADATPFNTLTLTVPGADPITVDVNTIAVTQGFANTGGSNIMVQKSNGTRMGTLESVSIDDTGAVQGVYSNGDRRVLAQVALATFPNEGGLLKAGASTFSATASSGSPEVGTPNTGGRGRLLPDNLEMSNVDLATEFTNMILTQRGFQANTRVITTADQMLEDVVNLRR
ncbi:MAG TPA: flagellar hook protein FlgE [Symbiobacteriaceae bacterium]|jgi:flagellar hook protein FlgE